MCSLAPYRARATSCNVHDRKPRDSAGGRTGRGRAKRARARRASIMTSGFCRSRSAENFSTGDQVIIFSAFRHPRPRFRFYRERARAHPTCPRHTAALILLSSPPPRYLAGLFSLIRSLSTSPAASYKASPGVRRGHGGGKGYVHIPFEFAFANFTEVFYKPSLTNGARDR